MVQICILVFSLVFSGTFGAMLYDRCHLDEDCGPLDSFCSHGICLCKTGFKSHDNYCIELFEPRISCKKSPDCVPMAGHKTLCVELSCACLPSYHININNHTHEYCLKNKGLHERCEDDNECYWGKQQRETMGCVNGQCGCKDGFLTKNNRKCIGNSSTKSAVSLLALTISLLTYIYG